MITFIIDKDAEMKYKLTFAQKASAATKANFLNTRRLSPVIEGILLTLRINWGILIGLHDYVEFSALTIKLNQIWVIVYLDINIRGIKHNHKEKKDEENNAPSSEVSEFFWKI